MFGKQVSFTHLVKKKNILSARPGTGTGEFINEAGMRKFLSKLNRKYTYLSSQKSPIAAVFASIYSENKTINYFVDTNHSDSYVLNRMHKVSFEEKPGKLSRWEKEVLHNNHFFEKGKIHILQHKGLSFKFRFYALRLGWNSFKPIYILDANKTRISGIVFIISKEKHIFINAKDKFEEEIIECLEEAIAETGQQKAIDPEVFLSEIDLFKMSLARDSNLLTLGTIGSGAWTGYSFISKLQKGYLIKNILSSFDSLYSLILLVLSLLVSVQYERIMFSAKKRSINDNETLDRSFDQKYNLSQSMKISDTNYLMSEYVDERLRRNKILLEREFELYLQEIKWLNYLSFKQQLWFFKRTFRPMSKTRKGINYFYNYIKKTKKHNISKNKIFYRSALQMFFDERADFLITELHKAQVKTDNMVSEDFMNIVKAVYFKNFSESNNNYLKITQKSREIFLRDIDAQQLTTPFAGYQEFISLINGYSNYAALDHLKLKLIALSQNKFRKEKIILNILEKMISSEKQKDNLIILKKLKNNIQNNFIYYGIFEENYQARILKPHIDISGLLDSLKQQLDQETALIAGTAKQIHENIDSFFDTARTILYKNLNNSHQAKIYRKIIQTSIDNSTIDARTAKELDAILNKVI